MQPRYVALRNLLTRVLAGGALVWGWSVPRVSWSQFVYFDGSTSNDFHVPANWDTNVVPGGDPAEIISIDDGHVVAYSTGVTSLGYLRVGATDKTHPNQATQYGRLDVTGGTLEVTGVNTLVIGRENRVNYATPLGGDYRDDSFVDGADVLVWQRLLGQSENLAADGDGSGTVDAPDELKWRQTFGQRVYGGEMTLSGSATVRTNGLLVGERTRGTLTIGSEALVDVRIWDTTVVPNQFGGTEDARVGTWGPAYETFGGEPGLDGNGLIDVAGTFNAKDLYLAEHGAKGELRLAGGAVNLNGELIMNLCAGCTSDPQLLAQQSARVTIVGSGGSFNVGLDPDPLVVDPAPPPRDLRAATSTAAFSFIADAGGVTPIVVAQNADELSGTARIGTSKLQLNLDAYLGAGPLTLIDAPPGQLVGTFGSVTFTGSRVGTVSYDVANGNVVLTNIHASSANGSVGAISAAEPIASPLAWLLLLAARRRRR